MIRTPCFQCRGPGSVPGWGTKISQAVLHDQKYFKSKPEKKKKRNRKTVKHNKENIKGYFLLSGKQRFIREDTKVQTIFLKS